MSGPCWGLQGDALAGYLVGLFKGCWRQRHKQLLIPHEQAMHVDSFRLRLSECMNAWESLHKEQHALVAELHHMLDSQVPHPCLGVVPPQMCEAGAAGERNFDGASKRSVRLQEASADAPADVAVLVQSCQDWLQRCSEDFETLQLESVALTAKLRRDIVEDTEQPSHEDNGNGRSSSKASKDDCTRLELGPDASDLNHAAKDKSNTRLLGAERSSCNSRAYVSNWSLNSDPPSCNTTPSVWRERAFQAGLVVALMFALFGAGVFELLDIPDDPGTAVLDTIMTLIMALFIVEFCRNLFMHRRAYIGTFFFWADILGTASMIFEISFLLGHSGKYRTDEWMSNGLMLRVARAAKVGFRAGRLSKLMKLVSIINQGVRQPPSKGMAATRAISHQLMLVLSSKVSLLTIVLILIVPLFQAMYLINDLSTRAWSERLELQYAQAHGDLLRGPGKPNTTDVFMTAVEEMKHFYTDVSFFPIKTGGFPELVTINGTGCAIPGASYLQGKMPVRKQNVMLQEVPACHTPRMPCGEELGPVLYFDFTRPSQFEAGMDAISIIFIVTVMALVSWDLSRILDNLLVARLSRLFDDLWGKASDIVRQCYKAQGLSHDSIDENHGQLDEMEVLSTIIGKLARLADLSTRKAMASEDEIQGMDPESRGVFTEMMEMDVQRKQGSAVRESTVSDLGAYSMMTREASLTVSKAVINTWDLDMLELEPVGQGKVLMYMFFDSELGYSAGRAWIDGDTFRQFCQATKAGYLDLPYHNYIHAYDVCHTVFRELSIVQGTKWLSSIEIYALLIAALGHDLGHPGLTNPFLVETKHAIALRYNDKSPLENMHCANLFSICADETKDVFKRADHESRKLARKVVIEAILHTDNAGHSDMVKNISQIYEMAAETCEAQAKSSELTLAYQEEVLMKHTTLWLELFLHLADVSNPLKPFHICKAWAWRVLDEFFNQGDKEIELGLPVGMLNDRAKVNRPGSQHGFINFLVAPLVISSVRLFPALHPLTSQMAISMDEWLQIWMEEADASPEDVSKREADVTKIKDTATELHLRV